MKVNRDLKIIIIKKRNLIKIDQFPASLTLYHSTNFYSAKMMKNAFNKSFLFNESTRFDFKLHIVVIMCRLLLVMW